MDIRHAILLYNFCILAGACYLVAVFNWSVFTIVFAVIFMLDYRYDDEED